MAVLPPQRLAGRIGKALQLAHGRRQHGRVVRGVDDQIAPAVGGQQRGGQFVIAKAAAALPARGLRHPAGVLPVDDLLQARNDVRVAVLAQLHHDPAAAHFVSDGAGGAGTGEGVQDEVAGVG